MGDTLNPSPRFPKPGGDDVHVVDELMLMFWKTVQPLGDEHVPGLAFIEMELGVDVIVGDVGDVGVVGAVPPPPQPASVKTAANQILIK